ncbi:MAG: hypothetical protein CTY31_05035 [Hyphomicrobium sp.]|nr:MAG: hypothetical protein CTY31_05035 [Hyphomicrobium sp.]
MADPHVVTALARKRAELSGDIQTTQVKLRQMVLDLERLDATLLMFDPDYRIEAIKPKAFRPPEDWSKRGEMTRLILGILRQAAEPLTSRDVALQLIAERALEPNDKMVRLMTKRCGVALRGQRDKATVQSFDGPGMSVLWKLP